MHFKRGNFFFSFCFLVAPAKVYKKVVKFSFKRQKIFWVLVFSFMYFVLVDATDMGKKICSAQLDNMSKPETIGNGCIICHRH